MIYPDYFTQQDIMEFEYDLNKIIDIERGEGFWLRTQSARLWHKSNGKQRLHKDRLTCSSFECIIETYC
jgi:hypothetical protein